MKFAYIFEKLNLRTLCPKDNPMADFKGRFMSVEADLSWTPQFGDVGENENLPVDVQPEPKKAAKDWISRPDTSEEPRKGQPGVGEARESKPCPDQAPEGKGSDFLGGQTLLSGGVESRHATDAASETSRGSASTDASAICAVRPSNDVSRSGSSAPPAQKLVIRSDNPEESSSKSIKEGLTAKDIRLLNLITSRKVKMLNSESASYKDELTKAMDELSKDPLIRFVGYGVKIGRAMGTLKNVPDSQLIEMPVAENLMVSFAIGLSLKGLKPVVFIERFDFILNALDAIVNHLDKIETISRGEFKPTMILRIVVGNRQKPLFTGKTHTQDFSVALRALVSFPVVQLQSASEIQTQYAVAHTMLDVRSTALVEYKDLI